MAPKISVISSAVMTARMRMRFLATSNVRSTAPENRSPSRICWPKLCTILVAPSTSVTIEPTSATRSWLSRLIFCKRAPKIAIGMMTSGMPTTRYIASCGASQNRYPTLKIAMMTLRSAIDRVEPTVCSMMAVSEVIRLEISLGLFVSKKDGDRRKRLACTACRMSATTRSPSQLTK